MAAKTITVDARIKKLVYCIKKEFQNSKVILFGSRAKGDAFNFSDWDLLVISNAFEGVSFRDRMDKILSLIEKPIGNDVEVFCYTEKEIKKRKKELGLIKTALETGIAL